MIATTINQQIAQALKARDEIRLSTLRMLLSAFKYEQINLHHELNDEEEFSVIRKEAKKRKDAIVAYKNANRNELAEKEEKELAILEQFLPKGLGEDEIKKLVADTIAPLGEVGIKDMGKVIGMVMQKAEGRADGSVVANIVKSSLTK